MSLFSPTDESKENRILNVSTTNYVINYMQNLYKNISNSQISNISTNKSITSEKWASTIRTFTLADASEMYYNLSTMCLDEEIMDAHLRISYNFLPLNFKGKSENEYNFMNQTYTCFDRVYKIISYSNNWLTLSIKEYVLGVTHKTNRIIKYDFLNCIISNVGTNVNVNKHLQFLIVFSSEIKYGLNLKSMDKAILPIIKRNKRGALGNSIQGVITTHDKHKSHHESDSSKKEDTEYYPTDMCQKYDMMVDFKTLGFYQEWIIAPTSFNAFFCDGSCSHRMVGLDQNPTNHATLQGLIHEVLIDFKHQPQLFNHSFDLVPKEMALDPANPPPVPCCVPDKLEPLTILYYDEWKNVVLKRYPDMIASSCGCH